MDAKDNWGSGDCWADKYLDAPRFDNTMIAIGLHIVSSEQLISSGKTIEGVSRIYNHVKHCFIFGFKLLVLCYWDGKSLILCDCSLHRECKYKNYGLNSKETVSSEISI